MQGYSRSIRSRIHHSWGVYGICLHHHKPMNLREYKLMKLQQFLISLTRQISLFHSWQQWYTVATACISYKMYHSHLNYSVSTFQICNLYLHEWHQSLQVLLQITHNSKWKITFTITGFKSWSYPIPLWEYLHKKDCSFSRRQLTIMLSRILRDG